MTTTLSTAPATCGKHSLTQRGQLVAMILREDHHAYAIVSHVNALDERYGADVSPQALAAAYLRERADMTEGKCRL